MKLAKALFATLLPALPYCSSESAPASVTTETTMIVKDVGLNSWTPAKILKEGYCTEDRGQWICRNVLAT